MTTALFFLLVQAPLAPDSGEGHLRNIRQLTFGGQNAEAYFSSSGRQLIFQRTEPDSACDQQFVINVDGTGLRRVSHGGRTTCGYFYADDRRIFFSSTQHLGLACPPPPDYSRGYVWRLYDYDIYTMRLLPDGKRVFIVDSDTDYNHDGVMAENETGAAIGEEYEETDEALDRAHLALNLRFPTKGEASGAQLRIWSRGLASVVSRTGWYAGLPPDTVAFVEPGEETDNLHRHWQRALADPGWLQGMGAAGRRHLETRHDPELYAFERIFELVAAIRQCTDDRFGQAARIVEQCRCMVYHLFNPVSLNQREQPPFSYSVRGKLRLKIA